MLKNRISGKGVVEFVAFVQSKYETIKNDVCVVSGTCFGGCSSQTLRNKGGGGEEEME